MKGKQQFTKNKKGITLVALVVTIVVLLILAAISLNLVLGKNGIVTRARDARIETALSQIEEQGQLKIGDEFIEGLGEVDEATIKTAVITELTNKGYEIETISVTNQTVKGLLIKDSTNNNINEISLIQNGTKDISVALDTEGDTQTKSYAKVNNKYYELTISSNGVVASRNGLDKLPDGNASGTYDVRISPVQNVTLTVLGQTVTKEQAVVPGTKITVKAGNATGTFPFTVKETKNNVTRNVNVKVTANQAYATGLSLAVKDGAEAKVEAGKTITIVATVTPSSSTDTVEWSIEGPATIKSGTVTANSSATAGSTITVKAKLKRADGTTTTVPEKTLTITVKETTETGAITTDYGTSIAASNAKDLIGAKVTNYYDNCDDDGAGWQVFYIGTEPGGTEERIYLISTDYIKMSNMPDSKDGTSIASVQTVENNKKLAQIEGITKIASLGKTILDKNITSGIQLAYYGGSGSGDENKYYSYNGFSNVYNDYSGSSFINESSKAKK